MIYMLEQCKSEYQFYENQLKNEEKKENNLLHALEGVSTDDKCPPKCSERSKIATRLQDTLITRRVAKDKITINRPIVEFVDSELGRNMLNKLKQKVGDLRKIEKEMQNRVYFKRKVDETPFNPVMVENFDKLIKEWKKNKNK